MTEKRLNEECEALADEWQAKGVELSGDTDSEYALGRARGLRDAATQLKFLIAGHGPGVIPSEAEPFVAAVGSRTLPGQPDPDLYHDPADDEVEVAPCWFLGKDAAGHPRLSMGGNVGKRMEVIVLLDDDTVLNRGEGTVATTALAALLEKSGKPQD